MKLYECPRNTWVRVVQADRVPPGAPAAETGMIVKFRNIDGMYSYCATKDGDIVYLAAWTEVEVVSDEQTPITT